MLHKFAPRTVDQYMNAAITFVAYFNRAPQFITDDEIRFYLRYQSEIRRLKSGSMGIIHGMLKFLYAMWDTVIYCYGQVGSTFFIPLEIC